MQHVTPHTGGLDEEDGPFRSFLASRHAGFRIATPGAATRWRLESPNRRVLFRVRWMGSTSLATSQCHITIDRPQSPQRPPPPRRYRPVAAQAGRLILRATPNPASISQCHISLNCLTLRSYYETHCTHHTRHPTSGICDNRTRCAPGPNGGLSQEE